MQIPKMKLVEKDSKMFAIFCFYLLNYVSFSSFLQFN